jgi:TolB-like protein/tetratricopeptide (TPR) repeat protein
VDLIFLVLSVIGVVVAIIFGFLQVVIPFVKGEVKFSRKYPFVRNVRTNDDWLQVSGRKRTKIQKSVVILPLKNLGKADDDYFAAGMAEEITNRLVAVRGLKVISRTSADLYVNTNKTICQIGEELGVEYALEGTVRRAQTSGGSDRVRVTSQLIRVADDTHLWADTYDRFLDDIFYIQSDIAQRVVTQLDLRLGINERTGVDVKPTDNIDAYHAYLRARYYATRPHFSIENWKKAIDCAQRAVFIDPNFVSAYVELSKAHSLMYFYWYDHSEDRRNKAKHAVDQALKLAPLSPQVHIALAHYYLYCYRNAEQAIEEIEVAGQVLPDNDDVLETKASIFRLQGRWDEALEVFKKAYTLSPRDASLPTALADISWMTRKYSQALVFCEEASTLAPDDAWPHIYKALIYWFWKGDVKSARSALENVSKEHTWAPWIWFWQEIYQGNYQAGIERLDIGSEEWIRIKIHALPKSLLAALAYELLDDNERARAEYDRARILLEAEVQKYSDDPRFHSSLGIAYAALGEKEKAINEGKKAAEILPISKDAIYGIPYVEDLAHIYSLMDEPEAALEQLEYLLSIPSWFSVPWIELDPRWRNLRDHPRYRDLMDKYKISV